MHLLAEVSHILQQTALELRGSFLRAGGTHLLAERQLKVLDIGALGAGGEVALNRAHLFAAQLAVQELVELLEGRGTGFAAAVF